MPMLQSTPHISPEEFLALGDRAHGCELIDGHIVDKDVSKKSSHLGLRIGSRLLMHVESHQAGLVYGSDLGFRCFDDEPGTVRFPDVSFISANRESMTEFEDEGYSSIAPDLVVEVVSLNDIAYDVEQKIEQWLDTGVKVVLKLVPPTQTIQVYRPDDSVEQFSIQHMLILPDVLPGFTVPLADIFHDPNRTPTP
jgi:Uma2 family endonuclease